MLSCGVTMNDLELLRSLLKEEVLVPAIDTATNKKELELKEPQHPSYSLQIVGAPCDTIAFRADAFPATCRFFRGHKRERKRADFVIVANSDRRNWIVYIEMKGGVHGDAKGIEAQLRGAYCLVSYCRTIGREFWKEPDFLDAGNYREHFVSVKNVGSRKTPSWPPVRPRNNTPETVWKLRVPAGSRLRFMWLVRGRPSSRP